MQYIFVYGDMYWLHADILMQRKKESCNQLKFECAF